MTQFKCLCLNVHSNVTVQIYSEVRQQTWAWCVSLGEEREWHSEICQLRGWEKIK